MPDFCHFSVNLLFDATGNQACQGLACENIRFSSLFPAGDVSRETSTRGQNIYEKRHPYSLSSIGSKPTKNFKNKKERKKMKEKHTQSEPKNKFTC